MKKLLLLGFIFISLSSIAQIEIDPSTIRTQISSDWIPVDTIMQFAGNPVVNDSVEYIFSAVPPRLQKRISVYHEEVGDTTYHYTKYLRLDLYRSRMAVLMQQRKGYVFEIVPNSRDEIIEKALRKAKQLNIMDNDVFFNYPLIDTTLNPTIDTTATPNE
jgi:hypothetical protein